MAFTECAERLKNYHKPFCIGKVFFINLQDKLNNSGTTKEQQKQNLQEPQTSDSRHCLPGRSGHFQLPPYPLLSGTETKPQT
jgi:hypothetical protein